MSARASARHERYVITTCQRLARSNPGGTQANAARSLIARGTPSRIKPMHEWSDLLDRQQNHNGPAKPPPGQARKERRKANVKPSWAEKTWVCSCGKGVPKGRDYCWNCQTHISKSWVRWY